MVTDPTFTVVEATRCTRNQVGGITRSGSDGETRVGLIEHAPTRHTLEGDVDETAKIVNADSGRVGLGNNLRTRAGRLRPIVVLSRKECRITGVG